MSAGIDSVLQAAVDGGVVPQVVAMAADADGADLRGGRGPEGGRRERRGHARHAVPDRLDDEDGRDHRGAAAGRARQPRPRRAGRAVRARLREPAGARGLRRRHAAPARRPPRKATVRQLASHTSGLSYWFWNADIVRLAGGHRHAERDVRRQRDLHAPLICDPGTKLEYGINTDWLGRVVEAASGQSLDAYLAEHILGPLGMDSTTFLMSPEQRANSVPIHLRGESGAWEASDLDWSQEPDWWAGGHGLYATPRDYLKFQRMLLGGGALGDVRSSSRRPSTRRSPTRSASSTSRPRSRPPTRTPRPTSTPARATSSASGCCSTARTSRARARPAAARGRASSTRTSGSTAAPA